MPVAGKFFSNTFFLCEMDAYVREPWRQLPDGPLLRQHKLPLFRGAVMAQKLTLRVPGFDSEDSQVVTYMDREAGDIKITTTADQVCMGQVPLFEDVTAGFNFAQVEHGHESSAFQVATAVSSERRNVVHSGGVLRWAPPNDLEFQWGCDDDWRQLFGEENFGRLVRFFQQNFVRCLGQARSGDQTMAFWLPSNLNQLCRASRQAWVFLQERRPTEVAVKYAPINTRGDVAGAQDHSD